MTKSRLVKVRTFFHVLQQLTILSRLKILRSSDGFFFIGACHLCIAPQKLDTKLINLLDKSSVLNRTLSI